MLSRLVRLAVVLVIGACATYDAAPPASVSIMTFNVENLFDTRHDEGKEDWTYLPLRDKDNAAHRARCAPIEREYWRRQCLEWDWNEQVLERKMRAVAAAILANGDGRGPDLVVLQEVENLGVLETLRTRHLAAAQYRPAVLLEGADARGIDVAYLSRLPLRGAPRLHPIRFDGIDADRVKDTRGILEATFELPDGTLLTGFAVHFPAPYHPTEMRVQAYMTLNRLLRDLPPGRSAFAAGDFNTIHRESAIIDRYAEPDWVVAHRLGCDGCPGTHYYAPNDDWSFLDMILLTPDLAGGDAPWQLRPAATRLGNAWPGQVTSQGTPRRFDAAAGAGVSDHWPLVVELHARPSR